ncbi:MAG: hypothetical protein HUJ96_02020 [Marinilabiliaceae bacterium]|nr:hypothetical protein [Marinilabiliaceae bacterium]
MKQLRWAFALASLLFGVAVLLFFALAYPHHLHFQEQYQLFLFEKGYVIDVMSVPGGLADLIGRFLTQFFLFAWVGATIIAVVLVGVQLLTYRLLRTTKSEPFSYILSFIPAVLGCCFLCDDSALMTAPIALLLILVISLLIRLVEKEMLRHLLMLVSIFVIYMMCGAFVIPYAILMVIEERQKCSSSRLLPLTCVLLLLALSVPVIWHRFVHLSLEQFYVGPHYYRLSDEFSWWAWGAMVVVPLIMLLPQWIREWRARRPIPVFITLWLVMMVVGVVMVGRVQSQAQENVMAYDFMARNAQWNRIIQKAQKQAPKNQVAAVALNLALAQRGLLTEHIFDFPQNGIAGLLPRFTSDYVSPLVTSEVLYRLGMINSAQRFVFEAQEAIPDFQKSARCYKRLAETNIINGAYDVARKYLISLQHTLFYRSWATATLALIDDDAAVNAHPEYGTLRRCRSNQNYFFGGNELSQILARQLESNPENRMAFDYLMASCMLEKELDKLEKYYGVPAQGKIISNYVQQALLLKWSQDYKNAEAVPPFFQPEMVQGLNDFYSALQFSNGNPKLVQKRFANTYWSYYFFQK